MPPNVFVIVSVGLAWHNNSNAADRAKLLVLSSKLVVVADLSR